MSYKDSIGFKANNYGNIKYNASNNWVGQDGYVVSKTGVKFAKFKEPVYGVRAIFKLLDTYIKNGNNTINKIIDRYAPSGDGANNPTNYKNNVSNWSGVKVEEPLKITDKEKLCKVVHAMIRQEIGYEMPITEVKSAYGLAFDSENTILTAANDRSNVDYMNKNNAKDGIVSVLFLVIVIILFIIWKKFIN